MNAPNAEELATQLNAMIQTSDHTGIWTLSTGQTVDLLRDNFGEWMSYANLPVTMRPTVASAAGQMRSRTAVPTLLRWLRDEQVMKDAYLRECVLYALGRIGDSRAAETVKPFETHANEWTRYFAKEASARIAGQPDTLKPRWSKPRMNLISVNLTQMYGPLVKEVFQGTLFETRDKQLTDELINKGLIFDDTGEPLYDVALLWFVTLRRSSPLLMWRLHHFARRGGQVILDGQFLYWIEQEYEMIGEGDAAIRGKLKREYRYQRGPWDELFPEKLVKNPVFPPLDDQMPMFKEFYYGYRRIGRGGCLLMSESNHTLDVAIKNIPPIKQVPYWSIPNANVLQRDILTWLRDGPDHRAVSIGWRNEPIPPKNELIKRAIFFAGAPAKVVVSLVRHQESATPIMPEVKLFTPDGQEVASVTGKSVSGKVGEWTLLDLAMDLPILTLPDPNYRLEIVARDASGKVLHRMERLVEVRGRFEIAVAGWPAMIAGEARVPAKVQIKDGSTGAYPPLRARLRLVNDDLNQVYRIWQAPWNGQDDIALDMLLPVTLPAAQYSLRVDLVDDKDQIYGRHVKPLARQAIYEQRRIFQWSEWIQAGVGAI
ncbi:MAG: HEAT repeat domain-containing protein, partial [Lentisphaerae bacterium]|nr:HEAT repeat domain-containing protein [Lentisphaerota bacterium]